MRFQKLGPNDVLVPGTVGLAFDISLTSRDPNRTVVQNLRRVTVKNITLRVDCKEIQSIDDSDIFYCYTDSLKTKGERASLAYQFIDRPSQNMLKLRVGAGDGDAAVWEDKAVADTYDNRFHIPLDFEHLESHMPQDQNALGERLEYKLYMNAYDRVIKAGAEAKYSSHTLEYDKVTDPGLTRMIRNQYAGKLVILYNRIVRHTMQTWDEEDSQPEVKFNSPTKSLKGVLILCEERIEGLTRDTENFYNPRINYKGPSYH